MSNSTTGNLANVLDLADVGKRRAEYRAAAKNLTHLEPDQQTFYDASRALIQELDHNNAALQMQLNEARRNLYDLRVLHEDLKNEYLTICDETGVEPAKYCL